MIRVTKSQIEFHLPDSSILRDGDSRKQPLTRDLISAHVCPNCTTLVQAVYRTEKAVKELTRDFFGLEKSMGVSKFAPSMPNHQVQPKFKSQFLTAGGKTAELIREEFHFKTCDGRPSGVCKVMRCVYQAGQFDLCRYLLLAARIVLSTDWYPGQIDHWRKLFSSLTGPDAFKNQANATQLFEWLRQRMLIAEDITGNGPPLWLLTKSDLGYNGFQRAVTQLA